MFAKSMKDQANKEVVVPMNSNVGTTTSKVRDFTRMNHPGSHSSKGKGVP